MARWRAPYRSLTSADRHAGSFPDSFANINGNLVLTASDGSQRELWIWNPEGEAWIGSVRLSIFVDGEQVVLPASVGVQSDGSTAEAFTTDTTGAISIDAAGTVTLGEFFDIWHTDAGVAGNNANAVLSSGQLLANLTDTTHAVQMFVNGNVSTEFEDCVLSNGDEIVLVYGDEPVVSLNTNFGPIVIELFEQDTPGTVANFLNYVHDGDYLNSFFHRSVTDFVVQGGGFTTTSATFGGTSQFTEIATDAPILNEPGISNLRGTVAMAKLGGDPDSATSQFFFNLSDDNTFLDLPENDSFTVFGHVLDMTTVDEIAALPIDSSNDSPFGELPLSSDNQLAVIQSIAGLSTLSGFRFLDANANGVHDSGEAVLAGAVVYLDDNDNGVRDAGETSTTTDTEGNFVFQVVPGNYTVRAETSVGRYVTAPATGSYTMSAFPGGEVGTLSFGETVTDASAVNRISGWVFHDVDGDGVRDINEVGVPGVVITLAGTDDSGTSVSRRVLTLDDGSYVFEQLPAGTYQLSEQQPAALSDGSDHTTMASATTANDVFSSLVLSDGENLAENNFGEHGLHAQFIPISWFFSSSRPTALVLRETIARTEELTGNASLAEEIRNGSTSSPDNSNPIALADSFAISENNSLTATASTGVLANDSDPDGDALSAILVSQTTHGSLTFIADGSFTYTPTSGYTGTDSFTYQARDGQAVSNTATVTLTVTPDSANQSPLAVSDAYTVEVDHVLTVAVSTGVLANDSDADGDALTAQMLSGPSYGTIALNADGSFTYTPTSGFFGDDAFTYQASDGLALSNAATVTLTVSDSSVDQPPVAVNDAYAVDQDGILTVNAATGVLANDSDADGDNLTALLIGSPINGTLSLDDDGAFIYTPNDGFSGTDAFTYMASDGAANSAEATVTITVTPVNHAPLSAADTFRVSVNGVLTVVTANGVLANDTDVDGDILTASLVTITTSGALTLNADGSLTYTPNAGFHGSDAFRYTVSDGQATSVETTVTIFVNDLPVVADDQYRIDEDTALDVDTAAGILNNDSDADGDPLAVRLITAAVHGTVTLNEDGSFTYTPETNFDGTDSFTYIAADGIEDSVPGTVVITVNPVNDAPVAEDDVYRAVVDEVLIIDANAGVLTNDSDVEGDALTATLIDTPAHGTVAFNVDGSFTYTPDTTFVDGDSFTYTVGDGLATSAAATVTIAVDSEEIVQVRLEVASPDGTPLTPWNRASPLS